MRVVAMFRVSTERQANEGASLDAQERRFRELAKASGWTVVAEFRGCESATQVATERQVLQQVLECIRTEQPDALFVYEQSRLTRGDSLEVALLLRELAERNVKVIVGGEVRDLSSIDGRFMVGIQSLVDRAEAERIRERSQRGKRERAVQGRWHNGKPAYGFRNPIRGEAGRGTLVLEPTEAAIVRQIFEWAAAGTSTTLIGQRLRDQGLSAPRGGRWGNSTVKKMLANPVYAGIQASNVWVVGKSINGKRVFRFDPHNRRAILVENAHPAIVPMRLWNAVRTRFKPVCTRRPNLLTGLVHVNDSKYSSDRNRGRKYYCPRDGKIRGRPWLEAETLDEATWRAFVGLATKPELIEELGKAARQHYRPDRLQAQIGRTQALVERVRARIGRLVEMRADGEITRDIFKEKTDESERQVQIHEQTLDDLRGKLASASGVTESSIIQAIQVLLGGGSKLTTEQKRAALTSIVRRVDVEAVPTGARQRRAPGGNYGPSGGPRWRPAALTFHLAAPATRGRQSGTTCSCSARRARARP